MFEVSVCGVGHYLRRNIVATGRFRLEAEPAVANPIGKTP